ncbi:MAG: DNA polymerase IV [Acidiferrobacterales bacterium]|nr:DNA polymerase IV [Acidiferrobacterales bacterium]
MILHIDMDAYYASVEEREHPELKGRPLVVGGSASGRGVISAANYAARAYGVRSAMPTARALRLCPDLIVMPTRGGLYQRVSRQIRDIFQRYTPLIEPLSLDEAFLDVRGSEKLYGSSEEIGWRIKNEIREELNLIASVGVAPNKFLAKLASDQDKPDGFTIVKQDEIQEFLDPLPVERIWGIGKAAQSRLNQVGIKTVKELRSQTEERLQSTFGKSGAKLWALCHGIDNRPVVTDSESKSISHETTFDVDLKELATLESVALSLIEGVGYRLRESKLKARTINIKVRYHDFSTVTRSKTIDSPTDSTQEIWRVAKSLITELLGKSQFAVRLIGAGVSNFGQAVETREQSDLFDQIPNEKAEQSQTDNRQHRLDTLADQISRKYGRNTIRRGKTLSSD